MAIFLGIRDELANALKVIKCECAYHGGSCKGCPLWIGDGTVAQRCGLNVYNGRLCNYPADWEIGEDDLAPLTHAEMIEKAKAQEPVYVVETWRHRDRVEFWGLLSDKYDVYEESHEKTYPIPFTAVDSDGNALWDSTTYMIGGTLNWVAYDHKPTERERAFIHWEGEENG